MNPFTSTPKDKAVEGQCTGTTTSYPAYVESSSRICSMVEPLVHHPKPDKRSTQMPQPLPPATAPPTVPRSREPPRQYQPTPQAQSSYSAQLSYPPQSSSANLARSLQLTPQPMHAVRHPSGSRNAPAPVGEPLPRLSEDRSDCEASPSAPRTRTHVRNASDSSQIKARPLPQLPSQKPAATASSNTRRSATALPPASSSSGAHCTDALSPGRANSNSVVARGQTTRGWTPTAVTNPPVGQSTSDMPQRYLKRSRVIAPSSQPTAVDHCPTASEYQASVNNVSHGVSAHAPQFERNTEMSPNHGIDRGPPLFSEITKLTLLKDNYRQPSSTSQIIRSKINYLRNEVGYRGLRHARGDGNSFYRSFALAYLEQIYAASDRVTAVTNALRYLEMAQKLVDPTMPEHKWSGQIYVRLRDAVRGMGQQTTTRQKVVEMLQYQPDSDNVAAYMRLLASAYIRLTPGIHGSVFQSSRPPTATLPSDYLQASTERPGHNIDRSHISALSRTLNVPVHIYYLDERYDPAASRKNHIPADCTRFIPPDLPVAAEPVALLFRPRHYDVLDRAGPPTQ
ncbi:cysteine proteinase [Ceratobasidium sp. AG-I]|nr:cysteine proteinase [Ceratobasidium sp. AG-I]